jgi:hypothetical protein
MHSELGETLWITEKPFLFSSSILIQSCAGDTVRRCPLGLYSASVRDAFSYARPMKAFRILMHLLKGVAEAALYCAHRTSIVSPCAFCEQEGHLAAPYHSFRGRAFASPESIPVAPCPYGSTTTSTNDGKLSAPFLSVTRNLNR